MKSANKLCEKNAELLSVKAGGTYSYHWLSESKAFKNTELIKIIQEPFGKHGHINKFFNIYKYTNRCNSSKNWFSIFLKTVQFD
jgi:hypothetical protein